jgi:hypothetical protein
LIDVVSSENDELWPEPDDVGCQELQVVMGNKDIFFTVSTKKLNSLIPPTV